MATELVPMRRGGARFRLAAMLLLAVAATARLAVIRRSSSEPVPGLASKPPVDSTPAPEIRFTDVTDAAGVRFVYRNDREAGLFSIVESLGGGAALFDFDGDELCDIFFTGGGRFDADKQPHGLPGALYRNLGEWRFSEVTAAANATSAPNYSHGSAVGDIDNDGFLDLAVSGYGGLQLFHNLGDGQFEEVSAMAGLADSLWSAGIAWGDFNSDDNLDLYVVHYVNWAPDNDPRCPGEGSLSPLRARLASERPDIREICSPRSFEPLPDTVFFSNGDGTFRDATEEAGLERDGRGLGVLLADMDLDGNLDAYVTNDTDPNFLYRGNGRGRFDEIGSLSGTAYGPQGEAQGSMGIDSGDYNGDGNPDLFVVNFMKEPYALYRSDGEGNFVESGRSAGIGTLKPSYVGFGAAFGDFDGDGDEDLVVANGHVSYSSEQFRQDPLLLVNGEGIFRRALFEQGYFAHPHCGRGLAIADLDNDGDLDIVVVHNDAEQNVLLRNDARVPNSITVRLVGTRSCRDATGAIAMLHTSAGDQLRLRKGGGSYLSHNDLRLFWGVPAGAAVKSLTIRWPSGAVLNLALGPTAKSVALVEPCN